MKGAEAQLTAITLKLLHTEPSSELKLREDRSGQAMAFDLSFLCPPPVILHFAYAVLECLEA